MSRLFLFELETLVLLMCSNLSFRDWSDMRNVL